MRQHQRIQRGAGHWPFVIALLLLLIFVYLWFDEKGEREKAQQERKEAQRNEKAARNAATRFIDYANELSQLVGWATYDATKLIADPAEGADEEDRAVATIGKDLARPRILTDRDMLRQNLVMGGEEQPGKPGFVKWLAEEAQVDIAQDLRTAAAEEVPATDAKFDYMTPELRRALAGLSQMETPKAPAPPLDKDDAEAQQRYEEELAAYEEAVQRFNEAVTEVTKIAGYDRWEKTIKGPRRLNPDQQAIVTLDFFTKTVAANTTVQALLEYPKTVIKAAIAEFRANKEADAGILAQARADGEAKARTIADLDTRLTETQARSVRELQEEKDRTRAAESRATQAQVDLEACRSDLGLSQDQARRDLAQRDAQIGALENRIRIDKEDRDLRVRRDEPDGSVLSASPTMGTAIVDLGTQDKVYPGLKFEVRATGRGGLPIPIGRIQITQVLGAKTAKAAILSEVNPARPIGTGDVLHNPYFDATDPIHVWFAGEPQKYPMEIVKARLTRMNVVVDAGVTGDTDYVVIPDAMAAPAPAAEGEEEEEEGAAAGRSEYERITKLARDFGATVVTESMLNEFLDF